jgi:predicted GNAT family N-acyltransferase
MKHIHYKQVDTNEEQKDVFRLRKAVFYTEQGIPEELDQDEKDDKAIHFIALNNEEIIATGRLFSHNGQGHISRIAVDKKFRRKGIGKKIVEILMQKAQEQQLKYLYLFPHAHLEGFYQSLGFNKVRGYSLDLAGNDIIKMEKKLEGFELE